MRRIVLLFMLLALCAGTAAAKRDRGSYVTQYLTITKQINTTLEKLHKDVLVACGEVKPKQAKAKKDKSRQRKLKQTSQVTSISNAELQEEKPKKAEKKELSPAEVALLRQQLVEDLPERVRPIRRRAGRLRGIGPVPAGLKRANFHVQQYSRHIDDAVDALKRAAYSGKVNPEINVQIAAAKADAAAAEREMGRYLDAKPTILPVAQR